MDTVAVQLTRLVGERLVFIVAARSGVWPGELQKYLSGAALPETAEPLEAIANACGADPRQVTDLVTAWYAQTQAPAEIHYEGYVFRGEHRAAPGAPPADLFHRLLHAVWLRTGKPKPVPGSDAGAAPALRRWQIDRLLSDRKLRDEVRRALTPVPTLPSDPDAFERRVTSEIPGRYEWGPGRRALDQLAQGLLHTAPAMRERARTLSAELFGCPPSLSDDQRDAVAAALETGADPRFAEWAWAVAPADRATVEQGILSCYRLAGREAPRAIVWADSPQTGLLLRRLADSLYAEPLWSRTEAARDVHSTPERHPDDLRERIDRELHHLLGDPGFASARADAPLDVGEHLGLVRGADPSRLRETAQEAAPRWGLHLDDHPLHESGISGGPHRYFHVDGQSLAPWIDGTTRTVEALISAGIGLGDLPERLAAYRDANAAGPWWPGTQLVIVCDRPVEVGPGPALRWADGATLDGHALPPG